MEEEIKTVLGWDDHLLYARTKEGELVFTIMESSGLWLYAPHGGATHYGSASWREDNLFVLDMVRATPNQQHWQPCSTDTDGLPLAWTPAIDEAFMHGSAERYLPAVRPTRPSMVYAFVIRDDDNRELLRVHYATEGLAKWSADQHWRENSYDNGLASLETVWEDNWQDRMKAAIRAEVPFTQWEDKHPDAVVWHLRAGSTSTPPNLRRTAYQVEAIRVYHEGDVGHAAHTDSDPVSS